MNLRDVILWDGRALRGVTSAVPLALLTHCRQWGGTHSTYLDAWRKDPNPDSGTCCTTLRPCELDGWRPLPHQPEGSTLISLLLFFFPLATEVPSGLLLAFQASEAPEQTSQTGHCPLLKPHPEKKPPHPPTVLPLCLANLTLVLC